MRDIEKKRRTNREWARRWKERDYNGFVAYYATYYAKYRLKLLEERGPIDRACAKIVAMRKERRRRNFENEIALLRILFEAYEFDTEFEI
jgi:hypothetical protein